MKRSRFAEENSSNYCISLLAEESEKALSAVYSSIDSALLILLVLLHSKIVYTLWFKHSDNVPTPHQQVCGRTQLGLAPKVGYSTMHYTGRLPLDVLPLILLYTIFDRRDTLFGRSLPL